MVKQCLEVQILLKLWPEQPCWSVQRVCILFSFIWRLPGQAVASDLAKALYLGFHHCLFSLDVANPTQRFLDGACWWLSLFWNAIPLHCCWFWANADWSSSNESVDNFHWSRWQWSIRLAHQLLGCLGHPVGWQARLFWHVSGHNATNAIICKNAFKSPLGLWYSMANAKACTD